MKIKDLWHELLAFSDDFVYGRCGARQFLGHSRWSEHRRDTESILNLRKRRRDFCSKTAFEVEVKLNDVHIFDLDGTEIEIFCYEDRRRYIR